MVAPAPAGKMIHLEAVRGLAALVVVVHHLLLGFAPAIKADYPAGLGNTPVNWMINGTAAVYLFFALSGYVLTRRFYERDGGLAPLGWAAAKRLPRLMLPAGLSILVGYLILKSGLAPYRAAAALSGSDWLADFAYAGFPEGFRPGLDTALPSIPMVFLTTGWAGYNSSLWTMYPEYLGSLVCFGYLALFHLLRRRPALLLPANLFLLILLPALNKFLLPFFLGTLMAQYMRGASVRLPVWAGLAFLVLSLWLCSFGDDRRMMWGAAGVLFAVLACPPLTARLHGPFGRWLGEMSFPVYLVHVHVICSLTSALYLGVAGWPRPVVLFLLLGFTLILSLIAAEPYRRLEHWWVPFLNRVVQRARTGQPV